jgi:hypothetical protein
VLAQGVQHGVRLLVFEPLLLNTEPRLLRWLLLDGLGRFADVLAHNCLTSVAIHGAPWIAMAFSEAPTLGAGTQLPPCCIPGTCKKFIQPCLDEKPSISSLLYGLDPATISHGHG